MCQRPPRGARLAAELERFPSVTEGLTVVNFAAEHGYGQLLERVAA